MKYTPKIIKIGKKDIEGNLDFDLDSVGVKPLETDMAYFMEKTHVDHIYLVDGFVKPYNRTHACLWGGSWCWSNAIENPKMAIRYIKNKLKR